MEQNQVSLTILTARAVQTGGDLRPEDAYAENLLPLDALHDSLLRGLMASNGRIIVVVEPNLFMGEGWGVRWDPSGVFLAESPTGLGVAIRAALIPVKVGDAELKFTAIIVTPYIDKKKKKKEEEEEENEEEEEKEE